MSHTMSYTEHDIGSPSLVTMSTPKALANKYGSLAISKFEIIGAYFVNLFYNEFYKRACTIKMNNDTSGERSESITDIYKSILALYVEFTNKPEFFRQTIRGVHSYCISTTNNGMMSHKECVEWLIFEFVPDKFKPYMREKQKNALFSDIVSTCVRTFVHHIVSTCLVMIIDNHGQENNVMLMQNMFLDIICTEKEKVYARFLAPDMSDTVPAAIFKSKLSELEAKNVELSKLSTAVAALKSFIEKTLEESKKTKAVNRQLTTEVASLTREVAVLKQALVKASQSNARNDHSQVQTHTQPTTTETKPVKQIVKKMQAKPQKVDEQVVDNVPTDNESHVDTVMDHKPIEVFRDHSVSSSDDEDGKLLFDNAGDDFYDE